MFDVLSYIIKTLALGIFLVVVCMLLSWFGFILLYDFLKGIGAI